MCARVLAYVSSAVASLLTKLLPRISALTSRIHRLSDVKFWVKAIIKYDFFKVVDFLLGDEDKLLKIWKVGGLAECQLELVHTQSKKGSLLSHSDV